jgi:hypothetical protein
VHFEPIDCLISFGQSWRNDADTALIGLERALLCARP